MTQGSRRVKRIPMGFSPLIHVQQSGTFCSGEK
uniref:Uncharacterized protein n=1 Tax=Anguilla anguilla TaxID=7936 RepID=A0A0E9PDY7_ANGAN